METGIVYRHFDDEGVLLYIGATTEWNFGGRHMGHKHNARWWEFVERIEEQTYPDRRAAAKAELLAIYAERPVFNRNVRYKAEQVERESRYLSEIHGGIPAKFLT